MPFKDSRKQQEDYSSFLVKAQSKKSHGFLVYCPSHLPFPFYKCSPPLAMQELVCVSPQWQTLSRNSLLNWYKPTFAGKISGSLLVSSNQARNQRRPPVAPGLVNKQVQKPQLSPLFLSCVLSFLGFIHDLFEGLSFLSKALSSLQVYLALRF